MKRLLPIFWVIICGLGSSAWCLTASQELSATYDEPFYARASLESYRTGSNYLLMRAGAMPLPMDVQYLPVYLWERQRGEAFDADRDLGMILPVARATNLIFWWLLLIFAYKLASAYAGPRAGMIAVALIATEPSFLGHACLASTDIACAATMTMFAYFYLMGRERPWVQRWLLPGVCYGLALSAKASAMTFAPILMVVSELPRLYRDGLFFRPEFGHRFTALWRSTFGLRCDVAKIIAVGCVFLFAYCGCDWNTERSFVKWADGLPNEYRPVASWTANKLAIFPNAGNALAYQIKHNIRGHGTYVLGEWHPRAVWYYFPVALSIKLTLPMLLAIGIVLGSSWGRALLSPLGLTALVFLLFTVNCRVQIGIRLVFPLLALTTIWLGVNWANLTATWAPRYRYALGAISLAWLAYPMASIWPDGLRYANEIVGGPDRVQHYLSDSNSDWGQGLIELDRYTASQGWPAAHVWYYGDDPRWVKDPNRLLALHWGQYQVTTPEAMIPHVRGKILAVGHSIAQGNPHLSPTHQAGLEFLKTQTPIANTRNFTIYDFRNLK